MRARVRREDAERQPPAIQIARSTVHEATDVVAPVREPRQTERQPPTQFGRHGRIGVLGIAAPMERITLAPRPCTASPDDPVARDVLRHRIRRIVVAHGVEVVLIPSCAAIVIHAFQWRPFAKVGLDDAHAHLQQRAELDPVPCDTGGIGEVEDRVFRGRTAPLILHRESSIDQFAKQRVLRREVGVLPEADVEAVRLQVLDHLGRISKARPGELVVAPPVSLEPACVEMQYVGGHFVLSKLGGNVADFRFRLVCDAAHPKSE